MANKLIKYLVLGDIHLGNPLNPTNNIIDNLRDFWLINHKLLKDCDVIFIEGDLYHKLLSNNSDDYILAMEWLSELIMYCSTFKIKLRILEGTPSHDWRQAKVVNNIITKLNVVIDFKYIQTLYIENMLDIGLTILYVPDEYKHDANDVYADVLSLLKENNLTQVDIAIMHGQFEYQLPMVKLISSHDENKYHDIVKHYITINHIHTASVFKRIIAPGSFDRLAHGEEEDKGCMLITISKTGERQYIFLKNHKAKIFKTLNYAKKTLDEIMLLFKKDIKKIPLGSGVRLIVGHDSTITKAVKEFKKQYLGYKIDIANEKNKQLVVGEKINIDPTIHSFSITRENVMSLLHTELEKHRLDMASLEIINSEVETLIKSI